MPDPISSSYPFPQNACIDGDGDANAPAVTPQPAAGSTAPASTPNMSLPDDGGACTTPPTAVSALVRKFSTPTPALPAPTAKPMLSFTGPTTSSGPVPGGGSYRVGVTALTSNLDLGPLQSKLEVGSASVQYGKDADVQVMALRRTTTLTQGGYSLSVTADAAGARANLGEHNDDGSIGGNIGAGVEGIGAEATLNTPYGSVTGGASLSASLSGSLGVRDMDHDGKPEFCAKFSIPAYTLGACVEQFW